MNVPQVTFEDDTVARERWLTHPRWVALLSDGRRAVGIEFKDQPASAWLRLKAFLAENGLRITRLWLQNRDNTVYPTPHDAKGYFFRSSVGALMSDNATLDFFVSGYLHDGVVRTQKFKVPEMILVEEESRDPADQEKVGPSLILSY